MAPEPPAITPAVALPKMASASRREKSDLLLSFISNHIEADGEAE